MAGRKLGGGLGDVILGRIFRVSRSVIVEGVAHRRQSSGGLEF